MTQRMPVRLTDLATEFERRPWLHHEVSHLPEKYRAPIVLVLLSRD